MKTERQHCGCVAERDREKWISLCPAHKEEYDERHTQAAADYRKQHPQDAA